MLSSTIGGSTVLSAANIQAMARARCRPPGSGCRLRRIDVAGQRPHDVAAFRIPAEVEMRGGAGPERRRAAAGGGAGRVEGHDVQPGGVDRAPRIAAREVAYLADAALAPQERLLEVHDHVHVCPRLPGHGPRAP